PRSARAASAPGSPPARASATRSAPSRSPAARSASGSSRRRAAGTTRSSAQSSRRSCTSPLGELDPERLLHRRDRLVDVAVEDPEHPARLGAGDVLAQVVDEDAVGRLEAETLGAEAVDLGLGLVEADVAGDDAGVEDAQRRALVDAGAPGVGDQ